MSDVTNVTLMYLNVTCVAFLHSISSTTLDARCHSERRQPAGVCPCPGGFPEEVSILFSPHILFLRFQYIVHPRVITQRYTCFQWTWFHPCFMTLYLLLYIVLYFRNLSICMASCCGLVLTDISCLSTGQENWRCPTGLTSSSWVSTRSWHPVMRTGSTSELVSPNILILVSH